MDGKKKGGYTSLSEEEKRRQQVAEETKKFREYTKFLDSLQREFNYYCYCDCYSFSND